MVLGHSIKAVNLPVFLKFGNAKKSDICVIFATSNLSKAHVMRDSNGLATLAISVDSVNLRDRNLDF